MFRSVLSSWIAVSLFNDIVPICLSLWNERETLLQPYSHLAAIPRHTFPLYTHLLNVTRLLPLATAKPFNTLLGRTQSVQSLPSPASAFSANDLPAFFFFFLAAFLDADAASKACKIQGSGLMRGLQHTADMMEQKRHRGFPNRQEHIESETKK